MNDTDTNLKMRDMALSADDSLLYAADKKFETTEKKFNSDFEQIATRLVKNNLAVNPNFFPDSNSSII